MIRAACCWLSLLVAGCSLTSDLDALGAEHGRLDPQAGAAGAGAAGAGGQGAAGAGGAAAGGAGAAGASVCGDGVRGSGEACDGADLGGADCASVVGAGASGMLGCSTYCQFDLTACSPSVPCGNDDTAQAGSPWPLFRGCVTNVARSVHTASQTGKLAWSYTATAPITSSPVIAADGSVIVVDLNGAVHRVFPSGVAVPGWPRQTGPSEGATPAIGQEKIFVGSSSGMTALDFQGTPVWKYDPDPGCTGAAMPGSLTLFGGRVLYLQARSLFDVAAGQIPSSTVTPLPGVTSCSSSQTSTLAINPRAKRMYLGVRASDQKGLLRAFRLPPEPPESALEWASGEGTLSSEVAPVVAADGTVYLGGNDRLWAFRADGSVAWVFQTNFPVRWPSVAADGTIYFGSTNDLHALHPDGTLAWKVDLGSGFVGATTLGGDGTIYTSLLGGPQPGIVALDPAGNQKWKAPIDSGDGPLTSSGMAIGADGTLFAVGGDRLMAFLPP